MGRPATPEDIDVICGSLPETELGVSWGDLPTWKVPWGEKGKGAVLVQQSRLGEIGVDELREIITDAWLRRAPKRLVKEHLADG